MRQTITQKSFFIAVDKLQDGFSGEDNDEFERKTTGQKSQNSK